jgi:hypothetical protein
VRVIGAANGYGDSGDAFRERAGERARGCQGPDVARARVSVTWSNSTFSRRRYLIISYFTLLLLPKFSQLPCLPSVRSVTSTRQTQQSPSIALCFAGASPFHILPSLRT